MNLQINLSTEEIKLIEILFYNDIKKDKIFDKLNYDKLIKIASNHLMLPALYVNFKQNVNFKKTPIEFQKYLREIYLLNRERNLILIEEVKTLSKILNSKKINYAFLKGSSLIYGNHFEDIGERMVGDIDLLVDYEQKEITIDLLKEKLFFSKYDYKFWDANVYPNFINKNKIFAIDLHNQLLPKKYSFLMDSNKVLRNKRTIDNISFINPKDELYYTIYNYIITDYARVKATFSYRKFYDINKLSKKIKIENNYDKYLSYFFQTAEILGINETYLNKEKFNQLNIFRFKLKKRSKYYYKFDEYLCSSYIFFNNMQSKIIESIFNKNYRKHIIDKLFIKN